MWETKELQKVTSIYTGIGFPKNLQGKSAGEYPFYKVGDISKNVQLGNHRLSDCENYVDEEELEKVKGKLIPEGTVVFAKIGEALKLNRRGIINRPSLIDNNAIGIKANMEFVSDKYLFYYFQDVRLEDYSRATTVPSVRKSDIEKISIPVPPLPTQNRIVEKIEELFSELDNGVENLKKAQQQLKTYRQAVLKDAFEGKLTKKWREQQSDLPTPEKLFKEVKVERKAHRERELTEWEKEVEQWEKDREKGKKPTKPRESRSVDKLSQDELSELHDLPEKWFWGKVNDITLRVEYGTSTKSLNEGEIPVLRMGNMQNGKIDWSDLKYSNDPTDNDEYLLQDEDVLFNRTNSPELVGKAVIYKGYRPAIFAGYLIRLNQIREVMNGYYLNYFLNSVTAKNHGNMVKTDGVNQSNINGTKLVNYPIPLCSKREQNQIVQEIETRLSVIDQLEQTINENLQKAQALRQSILKQAFSGELVD